MIATVSSSCPPTVHPCGCSSSRERPSSRERRRESCPGHTEGRAPSHQVLNFRSAPGTRAYESCHDSIMLPFRGIAPQHFPVFLVLTRCLGRQTALARIHFREMLLVLISATISTLLAPTDSLTTPGSFYFDFRYRILFLHCQLSAWALMGIAN